MSFRQHLQAVCEDVEGVVACCLMASDGIEVESHVVAPGALDLASILVEYSAVFRSARQAAEAQEAGPVTELSIHTEALVTVARSVSPDYFMVVALKPDGNLGKARYRLRVTAPRVKAEL